MARRFQFPNISAMKANTPNLNGDMVFVNGEHEPFRYDSSITAFDEAISFDATGIGTGAFVRQYTDKIDVRFFGFVKDRVTFNDTPLANLIAWYKTLTYAPKLYFSAGHYLFASLAKFDVANVKLEGDGFDSTFLVSDVAPIAFEFNFPNPEIHHIAIVSQSNTSTAIGMVLRNVWQASIQNVYIADFSVNCEVILDDEGESLIPGQDPTPPFTVSQNDRHDSWTNRDDIFRRHGITPATAQEHYGSRFSIVNFDNCHFKCVDGVTLSQVGLRLTNTLADILNDYDDNNDLSQGTTIGVYSTAIRINGGHIFSDGIGLHIGGGIRGVKVKGTYFDVQKGQAVRVEYGASDIDIDTRNLDGNVDDNWLPDEDVVIGDKRRIGENRYDCVGDGNTASNINHNGVPNSEFTGVYNSNNIPLAPVAESGNPNDLAEQARLYGMELLSQNVEIYVEGVSTINGQRWLDMSANLSSVSGSSQAANIFFGNDGLGLTFPILDTETVSAAFEVQYRDPIGFNSSEVQVEGMIRIENAASGFLTDIDMQDIWSFTGFDRGVSVKYLGTGVITSQPTAAQAIPLLIVRFLAGSFGWFPFRVSVPQINKGTLGAYVRTTGRQRSRNQDGPQGSGTSISDGTALWDFEGQPEVMISAARVIWEPNKNDAHPHIKVTHDNHQFRPGFTNNPLPFYAAMFRNPTNNNNDTELVPD